MTPDDLIAAVRARLDEIEQAIAAILRQAPNWRVDPEPWSTGVGVLNDRGEGIAVAHGDYTAEHIAFHDPAAVLRRVAADRKILSGVESWRHRVCEDSWYSCSQATENNGYEEYLACADEDRVGLSCDCGLDQRKLRILLPLADGLGIDLEETP